ncbi:Group-specific protein [Bacillus cereus Rock4-18]|nr:Group-specific protein [Bacillus cereus Rock4-18]
MIDEIQINNLSSTFKKQAVILIYSMFILKEMHVILFEYLELDRK